MKYIIKNCPNYLPEFFLFGDCKCEKGNSINGKYIDNCKDVTDCLLKQIVDESKRVDSECFDQWCFANLILEKLEIEEVNDN